MQNLIASKPQKLKIDKPDDYFFSTDHHMPSQRYDVEGDDHIMTSIDTPMRSDAFDKTDDQKISEIEQHFAQIMDILGLDRTDDSLKGTPYRVAKMLVEKDITFYSNCEYHFVPIIGKAHIANISGGKVIGLSKLNRIVQYYAKRPQVQERLTIQIAEEIKKAVETEDVAVVIEATHLCVSSRGVQDITSSTVTSSYSGKFMDESKKSEFLKYI